MNSAVDLTEDDKSVNQTVRNFENSLLRKELENRPSGLSLLVAAVDAQDSELFRLRPSSVHSMEGGCSNASSQDSHADTDHSRSTRAMSESGSLNDEASTSKNGRRRSIPDNEKDEHYWEKRRRNNEAAKRSREKRKINDMAMESRLLELSKENSILKTELIHNVKPPRPTPVPVIAHNRPRPTLPSIQTTVNSPFVPVKPEPRQNGVPPNVTAPLGYVPPISAPTQGAAAETMLPNPPIPTNPLTGLHAAQFHAQQHNPQHSQPPQSALAAALNARDDL